MRRLAALLAAAALLHRGAAAPAASDASARRGAASGRALGTSTAALSEPPPAPREAYVTFVVSEEYVLGARVLGQSLRESGTTRALVCLVAAPLSPRSRGALRAAGWALQPAPRVSSPHAASAPRKLRHVFAKLAVFNLTSYDRVVYLDADTLVLPPGADALFGCRAALCAALRHSERFNSGVMVLRPDAATAANMSRLIAVLPSYTGGDQGFLNAYFADLPASPLFDPARATSEGEAQRATSLYRLPTAFNADVGLYVLNGERWPLDASSLRVLHFTLGPLKPWHWFAPWLVPAAAAWRDVRRRTPPPPGLDPAAAMHATMLLLPIAAIGPLLRRRRLLLGRGGAWGGAAAALGAAAATPRGRRSAAGCFAARLLGSPSPGAPPGAPPAALTAMALAAALPGGAACVALAALLPPPDAEPWLGWAAFQAWTLALASLLFGAALECAHACGRAAAARAAADAAAAAALAAAPSATATARRAERLTRAAALAFAAAFVAAPWVPRAAGARGAPAMLAASAAAAAALAAAAAATAPPLAAAWFAAGLAAGAPLAPAEEAGPSARRHVIAVTLKKEPKLSC